jgi:hypothetical protein
LKVDIHSSSGKKYEKANVVSYRSQVVNGTNHFVKVKLLCFVFFYLGFENLIFNFVIFNKAKLDDTDEHLHLRIYVPFSNQNIHLAGIQDDKKHDDPLDYFDAHIVQPPVAEFQDMIVGSADNEQNPTGEVHFIIF